MLNLQMTSHQWILIGLCCALFPLCSSHFLADTIQSIQSRVQRNDRTCNATISGRQLYQCSVKPLNGVLPEGTFCIYGTGENTTETFICDHGYLFYENHGRTGTQTKHNIRKRGFFAVFGLVVGVIGLVLSVVSTVCLFETCNPDEGGETQVINKPPTIDCPEDIKRTATKQEESVMVEWIEPTASDPEGQKTSVKKVRGQPSGSYFAEGTHTIVYEATDNVGNTDSCSFVIFITVIKCYYGDSLYLENGKSQCNRLPAVYGDNCTFSCNAGYNMSSNAILTCDKDDNSNHGKWISYNDFSCNKKQCNPPAELCNAYFQCSNGNYFESVCYPSCRHGYSTEITRHIKCDGNTWIGVDTILPCIDVNPPILSCPSDVQTFADATGTAVVSWEPSIATDNSESDMCTEPDIKVTQISGQINGTAFDNGYHEIEYKAVDASQNSNKCKFTVIVEQLSCKPLTVSDRFLLTRCDDGFGLGAVCTFSCFLSYELVGSPIVTCVKHPSDENRAVWNWTNGTETFCEKLTCPPIPAPAGGALACSSALGNEICIMSCSSAYRVPLGTSIEYICNDEQVWIQGIPPNCTDAVHPMNAIQPGELFYYYDGDCSNQTVQDGIKDNFVQVMESLEGTDGWDNVCPEYCTVEGVTVTCGPLNGRRRKRHLVKRATQEITLSFIVQSRWQTDKDLWGNDADMKLVSNLIQEQVTNGNLSVPGTTTGSMSFGWIEMSCPTGLVPNYGSDGGCDGCAPGKYLKDGSCHECEKATYQDKEYQTNCTVCPDGQSTETTGATSLTQCKDKCVPGTYSTTGVKPCTPCPMGQYQTEFEATSCTPCDTLKYTTLTKSTNESDCQVLDMAFTTKTSNVVLSALENIVTSFTAAVWMKCSNSSRQVFKASFGSLNFSFGYDIIFSIPSRSFSEDVMNRTDFTKWTQVAISLDSTTKTVLVYGNGVQLSSFNLSAVTAEEMAVPQGSRLIIQSESIGCIVSGFYMVGSILTQSAIKSQSKVCQSLVSGTLYSMDSVYKAERNGIQFPLTSCDAVDECLSNPCKLGNTCINKLGGFECVCTRGYSGSTCEIPPDFCVNNDCKGDSTCVSHFSNYTCECPADFTGTQCEGKIVNGNWSPWFNTSECSATCNGGVKTRERFCNNPEPDSYGRYCVGSNVSTVTCNEDLCPECDPWYSIKQYRNEFNCTTSGDDISCIVTCQPGYSFVKDYYPLDIYSCGPKTSYKWQSKPPPCAPVYHALSLTTTSTVSYEVDCASKDLFSSQLSNSLNELQCVSNGTCDVQTSVTGCSGSGKKRSLSTMQVTIKLLSDLSSVGNLQLDDFYANNIVSPGLLETMQIYVDMGQTLYQMNSTNVLTVDDNGVLYEADLSTLTITTNVTCPDGKVEDSTMCVDCPSGTYWKAGFCVLCSVGTYQTQSGQLQCTQCPTGYTTHFIGSQDVTECNEKSEFSLTTEEDKHDGKNTIVIVVVVLVIVVLIAAVVIGVAVVKKRHVKNKRIKSNGSTVSIQSTSKVHPEIVDYYAMPPRYVHVPRKSERFKMNIDIKLGIPHESVSEYN